MKNISLLILILFFSCGTQQSVDKNSDSSKDIEKAKPTPFIPRKVLLKNGIVVPTVSSYKSRYYSMLPYLYFNGRGDFKSIKGDYISLAHPNHKEVNIICGFWSEYLEYKNILLAQVWVEGYNKKMLDTLTIQVKSSKHGILKLTPKKRNKGRYSIFEERLYTTEIALDKKTDILKKVYDDVITIFVGGYKYELINPELILD